MVTLKVIPTGAAKKKLNKTGKAKVKLKVTYTPSGGTPNTKSKSYHTDQAAQEILLAGRLHHRATPTVSADAGVTVEL